MQAVSTDDVELEQLAHTTSLSVVQHPGEVFTQMWHATSSSAGTAIVTSQKFRPSTRAAGGVCLIGEGVYLSKDRAKAENYRSGADGGVMLQCRARMGRCKTLGPRDPHTTDWHDYADTTGNRYNSAWKPAGTPGLGASIEEENCVFNPDRVDHIEIVDGPGTGTGPKFWPVAQPAQVVQSGVSSTVSWIWFGDSAHGSQDVEVPYGAAEIAALELAYQQQRLGFGTGLVRINATYSVNLNEMMQQRNDDASRRRPVLRKVAPAAGRVPRAVPRRMPVPRRVPSAATRRQPVPRLVPQPATGASNRAMTVTLALAMAALIGMVSFGSENEHADCIGAYGAWSSCSKTCGAGTQTAKFAIGTAAANDGAACEAAARRSAAAATIGTAGVTIGNGGATKSRACTVMSCAPHPSPSPPPPPPPPCPSGFTCVKTGAALVAKLKAASYGAKIALICTKTKRCAIKGVRLVVPANVEVAMEYVDVKDHTVAAAAAPCSAGASAFFAADASITGVGQIPCQQRRAFVYRRQRHRHKAHFLRGQRHVRLLASCLLPPAFLGG